MEQPVKASANLTAGASAEHDDDIDLSGLAQLLSNYGVTSGAACTDGDVDPADLAALVSIYGTTCD